MLDVNLSPLLGKEKDVKFGRCHSQEIDICAKYVVLYVFWHILDLFNLL